MLTIGIEQCRQDRARWISVGEIARQCDDLLTIVIQSGTQSLAKANALNLSGQKERETNLRPSAKGSTETA